MQCLKTSYFWYSCELLQYQAHKINHLFKDDGIIYQEIQTSSLLINFSHHEKTA